MEIIAKHLEYTPNNEFQLLLFLVDESDFTDCMKKYNSIEISVPIKIGFSVVGCKHLTPSEYSPYSKTTVKQ